MIFKIFDYSQKFKIYYLYKKTKLEQLSSLPFIKNEDIEIEFKNLFQNCNLKPWSKTFQKPRKLRFTFSKFLNIKSDETQC